MKKIGYNLPSPDVYFYLLVFIVFFHLFQKEDSTKLNKQGLKWKLLNSASFFANKRKKSRKNSKLSQRRVFGKKIIKAGVSQSTYHQNWINEAPNEEKTRVVPQRNASGTLLFLRMRRTSRLMASFFLSDHEDKLLDNCPIEFKLTLCSKFVVDCFLLFRSGAYIALFLNYFNMH